MFETLQNEFQIPAAAAYPYLQQQAENLIRDYKTALTGPLARGDRQTMEKNLAALGGDPFQEIYKAFVKAYEEKKPC
jgi:predicted short-subunit dehydrogenase-like oxidoreductase (DUF2520 family)